MLPLPEFAPYWIPFFCSFLFFLFTSYFLSLSLSSVPLLFFFSGCLCSFFSSVSVFLFLFCSFFFYFYFSFPPVFSLSSLFLFFLLAFLCFLSPSFCFFFVPFSSTSIFLFLTAALHEEGLRCRFHVSIHTYLRIFVRPHDTKFLKAFS